MEACGCGRVLYAGGGAHTKHVYSLLVWPDLHHTHAVTAYIFKKRHSSICYCHALKYVFAFLATSISS